MSDTRWGAHAKATEVILQSCSAITNALSHLHSNVSEKGDTSLHANNLLQKMEKLEFVFMLHFRPRVLGRFHRVSKALQKSELLLPVSTCAQWRTQKFVKGGVLEPKMRLLSVVLAMGKNFQN